MYFSSSSLVLATLLGATAVVNGQVIIETGVPELSEVIVIRGEGEIVDPDKWTEFPTPPPVFTNPPTPYPTPLSPAPTLINYILMGEGAATKCSTAGTLDVSPANCLDAVQLVGAQYNFPFYVDTLPSDPTKPCGCFLWTKDNGSKMVEFNQCGPAPGYNYRGYGQCDDNASSDIGGHLPYLGGMATNQADCASKCDAIADCTAYTWAYAWGGIASNCRLHFASSTIMSSAEAPAGFSTDIGCGDSCASSVTGNTYDALTVYADGNYGGASVRIPVGNYLRSQLENMGVQNDWISSLRVTNGYRVYLYEDDNYTGASATFTGGNYGWIETGGMGNDKVTSIRVQPVTSGYTAPQCYEKYFYNPSGSANSATQLICELTTAIAGDVADDPSRWNKLYGAGTEAGGKLSSWPTSLSTTPLYIRRNCPNCADSHKTIIYKRLTPFPYAMDVENLFIGIWSSANNQLNVDFELYSSMSYAQADLFQWTYCNYDDNVGFPRDCGPTGFVGGNWNSLNGGGQADYSFESYIEAPNPVTGGGLNDSGLCVGSDTSICGCSIANQDDYRGTISVTRTGKTCQAWTSQTPHPHDYLSTYPGSGIGGGHNHCRNPGSDSGGAWCYTTDPNVQWEYCSIPMCTHDGIISDWWNHFPYNGHVSAQPTPAPTTDQCSQSYLELSTADRNAAYSGSGFCDQNINGGFQGENWYRFTGAAGTQLVTYKPETSHCGTSAPGWLQGSHPTAEEGTVTRTVCFNWSGNQCNWSSTISIANCGGYYLYLLPNTPVCSLRYCGMTV